MKKKPTTTEEWRRISQEQKNLSAYRTWIQSDAIMKKEVNNLRLRKIQEQRRVVVGLFDVFIIK